MSRSLSFITLLLAALVLAPGMAHLLEMPHKMQLTQESYGVVQYIYGGWALLGIVQIAAVICSFLFYFRSGRSPLVLIASILLAVTLVVFFIWTYPVNRSTHNWSVLPENWEALRRQWEYSHAVNALLELTAYILLLSAVLGKTPLRQPGL
jgi:hypothetical protein